MLFVEPIVGFFSLYTAFTFAVLFAFFAAFPIVFHGVYGFTTSQVGLTFLAVGLGVVLAVFTAIACDRILYQKHYRRALSEGRTAAAPEHRLYSAMLGSMGIPIGLFWFGWTARADVHWASPVIAAIPFAWGNLSIFVSRAYDETLLWHFRSDRFYRLRRRFIPSTFTVRFTVHLLWPLTASRDTSWVLHSRYSPYKVSCSPQTSCCSL